ncbi:entry exclusion lipoprotein TrbK [Herbaspirillum rhizosphaerae]|uniref:entry exclusion lipoprotein TrbK n=1 Tax=Herbaspirillum rhizosphaerae TaxID=346179 RepID=UPI000AC015BF|nr:entry exclusion lipoprotein TrbK [Herbaspirillum rhizosphaerae]
MKLKSALIVLIVVAAIGVVVYQNMRREPKPPEATAANCSPEAIRGVANIVERSVISAQCAKQTGSK